jgi:hypothetical protein
MRRETDCLLEGTDSNFWFPDAVEEPIGRDRALGRRRRRRVKLCVRSPRALVTMTSSSDGRGGAVAFQAITNSSNSLPRRWRRTGATSASFIAAARLEDEPPQLSEVLTTIVKIRKTIPAKDRLADPIPSPDKARRRLARNLAQSPKASFQI